MSDTVNVFQAFGLPGTEKLDVPAGPGGEGVPKRDPDYRFREEPTGLLLGWHAHGNGEPLYIHGPPAAGKSSLVRQVAARLGIPCMVVTGHQRLEFRDLVGQMTMVDGTTLWMDGPLTTAKRYGFWLVIDEADRMDPGNFVALNGEMEPVHLQSPLCIVENGGETVESHPNYRVVLTANSAGSGDHSGRFNTALAQDGSSMDRAWNLRIGYPEPELELEILKAKSGLPESLLRQMLEVAGAVRELDENPDADTQLELGVSTRTLQRWAHCTWLYKGSAERRGRSPLIYGLEIALLNRASAEARQAVLEIVQRLTGVEEAA